MQKQNTSSSNKVYIAALLLGAVLVAMGIFFLTSQRQFAYLTITAGLLLLFFTVWQRVKRAKRLGLAQEKERMMLVGGVFTLALSLGLVLGYLLVVFLF